MQNICNNSIVLSYHKFKKSQLHPCQGKKIMLLYTGSLKNVSEMLQMLKK